MSHYFSKQPSVKLTFFNIAYSARGLDFNFKSAPGVFSSKKIDYGTAVLVNAMKIEKNDTVLDLGCGIGVVGIVAAHLTKNKVYLVDINKRAVKLAKMNSKQLKNVIVLESDKFFKIDNLKFDVILLNPPQTAGKKICFEMIEQARTHLNPKGTLQLVARHNVGGRTLLEKMLQVFGNVKTIVKKGGYRVYVSIA